MMYTFETHCKEDPSIEYNDGKPSICIPEEPKEIHKFVNEIRHDEEVGVSYMKSWEMEEMLKEEGREEGIRQGIEQGLEQGIKALIETCMELGVSKEDTAVKIGPKFSLTKEESKGYLDKYWHS